MAKVNENKKEIINIALIVMGIAIIITSLTIQKRQARIEEEIAEQEQLENIEKERIEKEAELERIMAEGRERMGKVIERNDLRDAAHEKERVPAPETVKANDEDGNIVTVTKVPEINPTSVPDEVDKPSDKEPTKPKNHLCQLEIPQIRHRQPMRKRT